MNTTSNQNALRFTMQWAQTLEELRADIQTGLTQLEAGERIVSRPNKLRDKKKKSILQLLLKQLKDARIIVLFGATAISFLMGRIIILVVIAINAIGVVRNNKGD